MAKMLNHQSISVQEDDEGSVRLELHRMDMASRRMVPEHLMTFTQTDDRPLTLSECLLLGAAEQVCRQLGYQVPLPF